ncbi:hypothetical protein COO91_06768 [Nostoc flagelliforme CCNUN1]|uniref:Uncharacterized protein n=1 Tax=Nostoc flagelliforme CCNUN1 TaxID=2038116 RepID=A0A2K8T163_9NOSO|nr:hypothetical protein COO91_06768 [Nostoc flagelliforme CCNUN1]
MPTINSKFHDIILNLLILILIPNSSILRENVLLLNLFSYLLAISTLF